MNFSKLTTAMIFKNNLSTKHKCSLIDPKEIDDYVDMASKAPKVVVNNLLNMYGPQGQKGEFGGIHFDSFAEYAFYRYKKDIECVIIERNTKDFFNYIDENGKCRKFFYDFKINGLPYEVKGILRPTDECKMNQCPCVQFVFMDEIKPMMKALDEKFPRWREEFQKDIRY